MYCKLQLLLHKSSPCLIWLACFRPARSLFLRLGHVLPDLACSGNDRFCSEGEIAKLCECVGAIRTNQMKQETVKTLDEWGALQSFQATAGPYWALFPILFSFPSTVSGLTLETRSTQSDQNTHHTNKGERKKTLQAEANLQLSQIFGWFGYPKIIIKNNLGLYYDLPFAISWSPLSPLEILNSHSFHQTSRIVPPVRDCLYLSLVLGPGIPSYVSFLETFPLRVSPCYCRCVMRGWWVQIRIIPR